MKYLIFDAGPIISLTMNGMLGVLEKLKQVFDGEFVITPKVKNEVLDRPMKIKKYKLEALQVKELIDKGVLKMSTKIIPQNRLDRETKRILQIANGVLRESSSGQKIEIIHGGEAESLAFSNLCGVDNVIVIDERTTRILIESPKSLEQMMEKKLHTPLDLNSKLLSELNRFKFIRSAELLFIAYKKELIPLKKDRNLLDAILYGLKYKGTAISSQEIEELKGMA